MNPWALSVESVVALAVALPGEDRKDRLALAAVYQPWMDSDPFGASRLRMTRWPRTSQDDSLPRTSPDDSLAPVASG